MSARPGMAVQPGIPCGWWRREAEGGGKRKRDDGRESGEGRGVAVDNRQKVEGWRIG